MTKEKVLKVASVVLIAGGVACAYFGGASEQATLAIVGVAFGVIAAIVAFIK